MEIELSIYTACVFNYGYFIHNKIGLHKIA